MGLPAKKFIPSNPGGKPGRMRGKGMTDFIGKATEDGKMIAAFFVRVLRGIEKGTNVSHKIRAGEWLADRFAGKAVEVALTGDIESANNPLADLDADQLRALIHKIVPKAKTQNPEKPPDSASAPKIETPPGSEAPPAQGDKP